MLPRPYAVEMGPAITRYMLLRNTAGIMEISFFFNYWQQNGFRKVRWNAAPEIF